MKYRGIGRYSATTIFAALAAAPWLSWLTGPIIGAFTYVGLEWALTWLAGKGIVTIKVGVVWLENYKGDLNNFNKEIEDAISEVDTIGKGNLTPEQIKRIDDKVRAAARRSLSIPGVR